MTFFSFFDERGVTDGQDNDLHILLSHRVNDYMSWNVSIIENFP